MTDLWILAYLVVTLAGGHVKYEPVQTELPLKICFETMWQLDEVYAPIKEGGEYKKFIEISCRPKTDVS